MSDNNVQTSPFGLQGSPSGFNLRFPLPDSVHLPVTQCSSYLTSLTPSDTPALFLRSFCIRCTFCLQWRSSLPNPPIAIQLPDSPRHPKTMSSHHYEYHRQDERPSEGKLQKEFKALNIGSAQHLSGLRGGVVNNHLGQKSPGGNC